MRSLEKLRVLNALDVRAYRAVLVSNAPHRERARLAEASDEELLISMHKARVEWRAVAPRRRRDSARWLRARGYRPTLYAAGWTPTR